jgi:hypothetical protein
MACVVLFAPIAIYVLLASDELSAVAFGVNEGTENSLRDMMNS